MTTVTGGEAPARVWRATRSIWTGRVLSGVAIAFFALDGVMKLVQPQPVIEATNGIGWPADPGSLTGLGALLLILTLLYALPRTSVLGAILVTDYHGGAVAAHVRIGSPLFTHDLFGVYLGLLVWGGLWLRDARLRALLPFS